MSAQTPPVRSAFGKYVDGSKQHLRSDFLASIVVFLVALPLCIGISVAVGVNPALGLITGIIGGLVVGSVAGSPLQVSGPAASLFVIVADIVLTRQETYLSTLAEGVAVTPEIEAAAHTYALSALGVSVVLAGIMQFVAGRMRLGRWFRAVSPAVIKGMLSGIGALILISQFHVMLDHKAMWGEKAARGGLQYLATIPAAIQKCFDFGGGNSHFLAAMIGVITILTIVLWNKYSPKKINFVPGALVGILVATLVSTTMGFEVIQLSVPANMFSETTFPSTSWGTFILEGSTWLSALVFAIVASAATLLTAAAVDNLSRDIGVKTDFDQELTSQGVGNFLCGLVGALPMTGVIVRSSANVQAGARTRNSTILHGAWLLLFVCFLPQLLNYIPRSALGALLVYTGLKLLNPAQLRELWKVGKSEAFIYLITLGLIVSVDLLAGVIVGIVLSAGKLLYRFTHLDVELESDEENHRYQLKLKGAATFLRLPILADHLEELPGDAELHVCLEEVDYIDHACFELLMNWADSHVEDGGKLVMDWAQLHGAFQSDASSQTDRSASAPAT
jgi:MFS superfamily sulfate permease-like transporter